MEARVFKWFGYVSLRPQDIANELHLYYILCMIFLDDYNVLCVSLKVSIPINWLINPRTFM